MPRGIPQSGSHRQAEHGALSKGRSTTSPLYLVSNLLAQPFSLIQGKARHQLGGQYVLAAQIIYYSWHIKEGVVFQQLPRDGEKRGKGLGVLRGDRPIRQTPHTAFHQLLPHSGWGCQDMFSSAITVGIKSAETLPVTYSCCQLLRPHLLPEQ